MLVIGALNWAVEWWTADRPVDQLVENARSLVRSGLAAPPPGPH
jgi:hypothetical protein